MTYSELIFGRLLKSLSSSGLLKTLTRLLKGMAAWVGRLCRFAAVELRPRPGLGCDKGL